MWAVDTQLHLHNKADLQEVNDLFNEISTSEGMSIRFVEKSPAKKGAQEHARVF